MWDVFFDCGISEHRQYNLGRYVGKLLYFLSVRRS